MIALCVYIQIQSPPKINRVNSTEGIVLQTLLEVIPVIEMIVNIPLLLPHFMV
jgi:hypothetical protein